MKAASLSYRDHIFKKQKLREMNCPCSDNRNNWGKGTQFIHTHVKSIVGELFFTKNTSLAEVSSTDLFVQLDNLMYIMRSSRTLEFRFFLLNLYLFKGGGQKLVHSSQRTALDSSHSQKTLPSRSLRTPNYISFSSWER